MASLLRWHLFGMDQLLGNIGDEVMLKPDIGELVLLNRIDQVIEVLFDVGKLDVWSVKGFSLAILRDLLGLGTHAWPAGDAADGVVIEVSVVLDLLLIEARIIWVRCFDMNDGLLIQDLVLILGGALLRCSLVGALGWNHGIDDLLLIQDFGFLPDGIIDVVDTLPSGGQTSGINRLPLSVFLAKIGNILNQDVLGRWIVSIVLLLDRLEESTQVILDLGGLGLDQLNLKERRGCDFDLSHEKHAF